jgi:hypothetical protein
MFLSGLRLSIRRDVPARSPAGSERSDASSAVTIILTPDFTFGRKGT